MSENTSFSFKPLLAPYLRIGDLKLLRRPEEALFFKTAKLQEVLLYGTITQLQLQSEYSMPQEIWNFTINDTTGQIDCIWESENRPPENDDDMITEKDNPLLVQLAKTTALCEAECSSRPKFKRGVWVKVFGMLEENEDYRYIRVKDGREIKDVRKRLQCLKEVVHLYDNVYKCR